jgi:nucleotide-binding universal stress UspA family protein
MKRVLIPIDGSECSTRAVQAMLAERARLANPDELELHLLHVEPTLTKDISRFVDHEQLVAYRHEQSENAFGAARALLDAAGARYQVHEGLGHVAEVVTRLAETLRCDQITMGTHGRGALADLLMGSTTLKVVHLSSVPVLLVK